MFLFRKIYCHLKEQRFLYLLLLAVIFAGFLTGCFYANLISSADFSIAEEQAEQFIKEAKASELSFQLMLFEELFPYLCIALCSLFLFGFLPTGFLVFKWGFTSGFFLTFLVKCFSVKGFFLGGFFLLPTLLLFLPTLVVLSTKSLAVNRFLWGCALHRPPARQNLWEELTGIVLVTLGTLLSVSVGVFVKFILLPPLANYLFL